MAGDEVTDCLPGSRTVFWWPSYGMGEIRHGGDHRSAQIGEILRDVNLDVQVLDAGMRLARRDLPLWLSRRVMRGAWRGAGDKGAGVFARDWATLAQLRRVASRPSVVLWESTRRPGLARNLTGLGHRVIALPHNLEALEPGRFSDSRRFARAFAEELDALQRCSAVFTISGEDAWLLRVRGINARVLPYHLATELRARLSAIRARREAASAAAGRLYLILGSCSNPPTRAGMTTLLHMLAEMPKGQEVQFKVVGNGTESLRGGSDLSGLPGTEILGRVTDEALDDLRVRCTAIICHQVATSGVLTRVPESLLAGVPVLANVEAARGWENLEGVYRYQGAGELESLLGRPLPIPSKPPEIGRERDEFLAAIQEHQDACEG